jgi:hypothetical protein
MILFHVFKFWQLMGIARSKHERGRVHRPLHFPASDRETVNICTARPDPTAVAKGWARSARLVFVCAKAEFQKFIPVPSLSLFCSASSYFPESVIPIVSQTSR